MQEFSRKVERIIKDSKMSKRNLDFKFENFDVNNNNRKIYQNLKDYTQKLMNETDKKRVILVGTNGVRKNPFGL